MTEHLNGLIEAGVTSGRFSNASEVVREGLRLLEQREAEDQAKLSWLRSAAQESFAALDQDEGTAYGSIEELAESLESASEKLIAHHRA